jgi:MFS family permease
VDRFGWAKKSFNPGHHFLVFFLRNLCNPWINRKHMTQDYKIWQVIGASSVGTMIEWYDFYIFGSLATVIAPLFYPQGNNTLALIAYLSTFAVGFVVRPFGALFFGRIGDLVGRKYAFLVTLMIMGGATALIGFLPTYATIGIAAPLILLVIRILQGLALGGEYGGAAVYVAEHVPDARRGFSTQVSFRSRPRWDYLFR